MYPIQGWYIYIYIYVLFFATNKRYRKVKHSLPEDIALPPHPTPLHIIYYTVYNTCITAGLVQVL